MLSAATWNTAATKVIHAMNFTDVDDKIINRANREGVDPFQLAEGYIIDFRRSWRRSMFFLPPSTRAPRRRSTRSSR
jgi:cysteinyl-tRNA synthetase